MSDFELEAWEIPPGVDASQTSQAVFASEMEQWKEGKAQMMLRSVPRSPSEMWVFFRPSDGSGINFLACESERGSPIRPVEFSRDFFRNRRYLFFALRHGSLPGRVFFLDDACVFINENEGGWFGKELAPFLLPFSHLEAPSKTIFDWIKEQKNDVNSEVRFALGWSNWDDETRAHHADGVLPEWRELRRLMRAVALLDPELNEGLVWHLGDEKCPSGVGDNPPHHLLPFSYDQLAARLQRWSEVFKPHFFPFPLLPENAPLVLQNYFADAANTLSVRGEGASAHQKLEARLQLRQWLERNAPDQIETMLPS